MRRQFITLALLILAPQFAAAQQAETIEYYAHDAIGSIRVVFNPAGTVLARQDYAPFGRQLFTVPAMPKEGFGGQEKDAETEQGYFHARQYQNRTGRFTRVDPIYAGLFEPQRWNRYAYALNSPLSYVDPQGLSALGICIEFAGFCIPDVVDLTRAGPGGIGGGGFSNASGRGGGGERDSEPTKERPTDRPPSDPPKTPPPPTVAEACVQGLAGFIDGGIPFADPFRARGVYDDRTPGLSISTGIGEQIRDLSVGVLAGGAVLANVAWQANAGARAGSGVWHIVSNNRFLRVGLTSMGYGVKTPAVRFGNSSTGKFLTHIDLMPRFFSKPTVRLVKKCLK